MASIERNGQGWYLGAIEFFRGKLREVLLTRFFDVVPGQQTMKCLVINLDRSPVRLAHMTAEFARFDIAFERVAAVDGINGLDLAESAPRLSLPEIACFLSHKACWRIVAEGDDAYGAIFEDDAVFSATAGPLLADGGWIPVDADIVKLETMFRKTTIGRTSAPAGHGFSVSRLYGDHPGAAGYIVSRQTARRLVEATRDIEIDIPVDHYLFEPARKALDTTIYQILPALCVQGQVLDDKANELVSGLHEFRPQWQRKSGLAKFFAEASRVRSQIVNICMLRRKTTVSFDYRGERISRSTI